MTATTMLLILAGALFGALVGAIIVKKSMEARMASATNAAQKIIDEATKEAETLKKEATLQYSQIVKASEIGLYKKQLFQCFMWH